MFKLAGMLLLLLVGCSGTVIDVPVDEGPVCSWECAGDQGSCHAWQTEYRETCGEKTRFFCCDISPVDPVCVAETQADCYCSDPADCPRQ